MEPERCDVVRSEDPFKLGTERQRPWLICNNDAHPFSDEQFLAVAVSTKEYDQSIAWWTTWKCIFDNLTTKSQYPL